jgi:predicted nucleic-acid-binding protein
VIRLFVDDDPAQAQAARDFVRSRCSEDNPGHVDRVALCELVWVLGGANRYSRADIGKIVEELLMSADIVLEDDQAVRAALQAYVASNVDFADALIGEVNRLRGCEATATFDRKPARLDGFIRVS